MDFRNRQAMLYSKQNSGSTGTPGTPASPTAVSALSPSPLNRHVRSGSAGSGTRRTQNARAAAAAQRLAHVMAHQSADDGDGGDGDGEDDLIYDYYGGAAASGRAHRSRSPMTVRSSNHEQSPISRPISGQRLSSSLNSLEKLSSAPSSSSIVSNSSYSNLKSTNSTDLHSSQPNSSIHEQPSSGRSTSSRWSPQVSAEQVQPPSARSFVRPHLGVKTVPMVPASVAISLKPPPPAIPADVHVGRDKRLSMDLSMNLRESSGNNQRASSVLQDELDMLQEENESLLEKLRLAEERSEEAEARARQLEKQVANLGEGVTLEARLLNKKEAAIQQREAALRVAETGRSGLNHEIVALRTEAEVARDEAASALESLHEAESELRSLRRTTQRMILSKEEMEEVVLKRCWLARYWSLCVELGVHPEIAKDRYEYWSSLAPSPVEFMLSAGQKAKDDEICDGVDDKESEPRDVDELPVDESIENMLLVEKGMRELALLKVEEAVMLAMALRRLSNSTRSFLSVQGGVDDLKLPIDGQLEAFELSKEESENVVFKKAWLMYLWRRAKKHEVEQDIAEERLQFWVTHDPKQPTSHDAVDVERGLVELRKLGIETQLWEQSRKELEFDLETSHKSDF